MNNLLQVRIVSPKQVIFSGEATSVSSTNSVGNFDILPKHANFLTLVEKVPLIIRKPDKEKLTFNFPLAIIFASQNRVNIYIDIQLEKIISN